MLQWHGLTRFCQQRVFKVQTWTKLLSGFLSVGLRQSRRNTKPGSGRGANDILHQNEKDTETKWSMKAYTQPPLNKWHEKQNSGLQNKSDCKIRRMPKAIKHARTCNFCGFRWCVWMVLLRFSREKAKSMITKRKQKKLPEIFEKNWRRCYYVPPVRRNRHSQSWKTRPIGSAIDVKAAVVGFSSEDLFWYY